MTLRILPAFSCRRCDGPLPHQTQDGMCARCAAAVARERVLINQAEKVHKLARVNQSIKELFREAK